MLGFVLPSRWGCAMYRRKPCWTSGPLKLPHSFHKQMQPRQEGHDLLLPVLQFLHPLTSQIVSSTASRCTDRPLRLALPWPFLLSEHYKQIKTFYRKKILKTEIISVWILAMKESTTCQLPAPHLRCIQLHTGIIQQSRYCIFKLLYLEGRMHSFLIYTSTSGPLCKCDKCNNTAKTGKNMNLKMKLKIFQFKLNIKKERAKNSIYKNRTIWAFLGNTDTWEARNRYNRFLNIAFLRLEVPSFTLSPLMLPDLTSWAKTHCRFLFSSRDLLQPAPPADGCLDTITPTQLLRKKNSKRRQGPGRGRQRIK